MTIFNTFKYFTLIFVALVVALPTFAKASDFIPRAEKKLEQEDRLKQESLASAYQVAAAPQKIFVTSPSPAAVRGAWQISPKIFTSTDITRKEDILRLLNALNALTSSSELDLSFATFKAPGAWADTPTKADIVAEKSIALSDPGELIYADKPLDNKGRLNAQTTNLVNNFKIRSGDTVILAGGAASAVKTILLKNGARPDQIKVAPSFAPSELNLELSGLSAKASAAEVTGEENFAAIQVMHRATVNDLSVENASDPVATLQAD